MTDMTLNGLGGLEAAWAIIANAYGGDWESAPDDWRAVAERWRDEVWHAALDASRVSPDPPLRFDNATAVREIAYRCAGAGSGAVMRLAGDVVMPAAEIGEAVEEILCDFWPEAADRAAATPDPDECPRCEGTGDRFGRSHPPLNPCPDCGGRGCVEPCGEPAAATPDPPAGPIPGPDPGACPRCGGWRKAGMIHRCPAATPDPPCTHGLTAGRGDAEKCLECGAAISDPETDI